MPLAPNALKAKVARGESLVGTWSSLSSANAANVIGTTDLDFVILDLEHGSAGFETAENMIRAVQTTPCTPIIRTTDDAEATILRTLEIGCQAIMIPHVEDAPSASRVVRACKYHPEGNRGLGPYTRHHDFSHENLPASLARANEETFVGVLVEGAEGVGRVGEIAKTPGLDLVYLGVYDISQSVGVPGELEHPKVVDGLARSAEKIRAAGRIAGSYAPTIEYAERLHKAGFQFIAYLVDSAALRGHYLDFLAAFRRRTLST